MYSYKFADAFLLVYDNEGQTQENETQETETQETETQETEGGEKNEGNEKNQNQKTSKTFTQDDVNRILAEDRRKAQKNRETLVKELQALKENKNLTEKQRDDLEARIEQLQNETLTAQEVAKRDKEKITKQYTKELETERIERQKIWNKYSSEKIKREIQDAAIDHDAISPTQIINLLEPSTKLIAELNKEGQPTGEYVSRVSFRDKDEKGETITLELSVTDAVKRMKEMQDHWNLFKSGSNGGLGAFNTPQQHVSRGGKPPSDPKQYRIWREAQGIKR